MQCSPDRLLFISDTVAELDAAHCRRMRPRCCACGPAILVSPASEAATIVDFGRGGTSRRAARGVCSAGGLFVAKQVADARHSSRRATIGSTREALRGGDQTGGERHHRQHESSPRGMFGRILGRHGRTTRLDNRAGSSPAAPPRPPARDPRRVPTAIPFADDEAEHAALAAHRAPAAGPIFARVRQVDGVRQYAVNCRSPRSPAPPTRTTASSVAFKPRLGPRCSTPTRPAFRNRGESGQLAIRARRTLRAPRSARATPAFPSAFSTTTSISGPERRRRSRVIERRRFPVQRRAAHVADDGRQTV